MSTYLKYITHLGPLAAILLSALALLAWVPDFLHGGSDFRALIAALVLAVANGLLLMWMCYHTSVTRYREPLILVLYLWFHAAFPELHAAWRSEAAVLFATPVIIILQRCRLNPQAQELSFIGTLLLLFATCLMPGMVWMIPVFWVALIYQQALTARTFAASLVAIALAGIYLFFFGWFFPEIPLGRELMVSYSASSELFSHWLWVKPAVAVMLMVAVVVQVLWRLHKENNHTRFAVVLSIMMFFVGLLIVSLPWYGLDGWPMVLYPATLLTSIYFWQRETVFRGVFFLLLFVLCAVGCFF